jgi:general secretion pathway protein A
MYNEFFGFSESPFKITPNSRFYYPTASCEEALRIVRHAVETWKGVILVTGQPGTGKTLFLKSLARDMSPGVRTVILYNPLTDLNGLLRLLLSRLDLNTVSDDSAAMLDQLTAFLIEQRRDGRTVCLLIDEAQDLEEKTLDELRLLSNLDFEDEALLPIVLLGQPELEMKLDHPLAKRMKQRVALTRHTYPLIRMEIGPYIRFRLKVANYNGPDLFGPQALEKIAAYSGGIPRMVNSICDNSLIRAYTANRKVISAEFVDQVAREMRITAPLSLQKQPWPSRLSETRPESAPFAGDAESSIPETMGSPAEEQHRESLGNSDPTALHADRTDSIGSDRPGATEAIQRSPNIEASSDSDAKTTLGPDPGAPANGVGSSASYARQGAQNSLFPRGFTWRPSVRHSRMTFGLYWYAVAGVIGVSMLVFGIIASHSQLAVIYSAAATAKLATVYTPSYQFDAGETAQGVEANGALMAPSPLASSISAQRPIETAALHVSQELQSEPGTASGEVNGKKSDAMKSGPQLLPRNDKPQRAQPADSPGKNNGKKSNDAAATVKVVSASLVRNKPTDGAEIISTLEPGSRVRVVAMSRDYYHVRSMDEKPIRGYVHREDAFFDRRK